MSLFSNKQNPTKLLVLGKRKRKTEWWKFYTLNFWIKLMFVHRKKIHRNSSLENNSLYELWWTMIESTENLSRVRSPNVLMNCLSMNRFGRIVCSINEFDESCWYAHSKNGFMTNVNFIWLFFFPKFIMCIWWVVLLMNHIFDES